MIDLYIVTQEWVLEEAHVQEGFEILCVTNNRVKALLAFRNAMEHQITSKTEGNPISVCDAVEGRQSEDGLPIWETWEDDSWDDNHMIIQVRKAAAELDIPLLHVSQRNMDGCSSHSNVTVVLAKVLTSDQQFRLKKELISLRDSHRFDDECDDAIVAAACAEVLGPEGWKIPGYSAYIEF